MVTGGHYYYYYKEQHGYHGIKNLDSTELLRPGSDWQEITSARLPRPMWGVRVNTVDNRVLLTGE